MPKFNYFDSLEQLSTLTARAVYVVCSSQKSSRSGELSLIHTKAEKQLSELEKALFSDFMPPLERGSIARAAHALETIINSCCDILSYLASRNIFIDNKYKEAQFCIRLAKSIEENVFKLKKIKKPNEFPDTATFRSLLFEARTAHNTFQKKLACGDFSKEFYPLFFMLSDLKAELAQCFNSIVEIMLENI